jgi:hypothetical protein
VVVGERLWRSVVMMALQPATTERGCKLATKETGTIRNHEPDQDTLGSGAVLRGQLSTNVVMVPRWCLSVVAVWQITTNGEPCGYVYNTVLPVQSTGPLFWTGCAFSGTVLRILLMGSVFLKLID